MRSTYLKSVFFGLLHFFLWTSSNAATDPNWDFEQADTNGLTFNPGQLTLGPVNQLLPGWQIEVGLPGAQQPLDTIAFNPTPFDSQRVSLIDYNPWAADYPWVPFTGHYSVFVAPQLQSTFSVDPLTVSLLYRGQVPAGADQMLARGMFAGVVYEWQLTMNGITVPAGVGFSGLLAFDVSQFAGKEVDLRLNLSGGVRARIESIEFIPEPPITFLWVLAASLLIVGPRCRLLPMAITGEQG